LSVRGGTTRNLNAVRREERLFLNESASRFLVVPPRNDRAEIGTVLVADDAQ